VPIDDSAYPYHDWNERLAAECYVPNTAAKILDRNNHRIVSITNNYIKTSFSFNSTLLSWLAEHCPSAYLAIIEADRKSLKQFSGHGSAIRPFNLYVCG